MKSASPIAACTIVSKNYLALARVWNESVRRHHPEARTFVLVVDRIEGAFDPRRELFEVIEVEDLGIPDFRELAFKYSILELNTAAKPFFLEFLFQRKGVERLVYLDPDTVLYGRIDRALEILEEKQIILVPHILAPQEPDGLRPDERDFLISGAYNLGFLALAKSETTLSFLLWWQEKLMDGGFSAPERGLFTDQKWIDLVPSLFPGVEILKDRGYNVAYWNLRERMDLAERDGIFRFPECPLAFFHFSGLEFEHPERVSKYQNRFRFHTLPGAYRTLISRYLDAVRAAGFGETRKLPYAFGFFDDGVRIPAYLRQLYAGQGAGRRRFGDPFRPGGGDSFRGWLLEPSEFGSKIPRLLAQIYETRPDVRGEIPNGKRGNAKALLAWAIRYTPKEYGLDGFFTGHFRRTLEAIEEAEREEAQAARAREAAARAREAAILAADTAEPRTPAKRVLQRVLTPVLYRRLRRGVWRYRQEASARGPDGLASGDSPSAGAIIEQSEASRYRDASLPFGVNLFGYFDTESGVGEIARSMAAMLDDAGIPRALINIGQEWLRRNDRRVWRFSASNPYAANLFVVNADQVPHVIGGIGEDACRGRINVGYWFWELSTFPAAYAGSFAYFDEIWVASEFCRSSIAAASPVPVVRVPPGFEFPAPRGRRSRFSFGLRDDDFVFLYVFDSLSLVARKNPGGLIRAFRTAFPNPSGERLVLKTINSTARRTAALERLAKGSPVDLLGDYLDREDLLELVAASDCYVSLHRSEGLSLTLLEAMALGKPAIATNYSGNEDFLRPGVGLPVGYALVPLRRRIGPYEKGALWAEPDVAEAARWMRWVRDNPLEAARVGEAAKEEVRRSWSVRAASRGLRERLDRLFEETGEGPGLRPAAPRSPA